MDNGMLETLPVPAKCPACACVESSTEPADIEWMRMEKVVGELYEGVGVQDDDDDDYDDGDDEDEDEDGDDDEDDDDGDDDEDDEDEDEDDDDDDDDDEGLWVMG
ncbi:hypothetical protein FQN50_007259 [Emmonsiellopsis sp. PD_5]|nr:hypothetical protein FQN50_007259 [Emmonsiellopsis sp. PD_5]